MSEAGELEDVYLEESALFLESIGLPRMAGRILAWLLICDPPEQTMPQIAERLQASKSSISTMTRMLAQFGMVERVSIAGERKDFYRVSPDFWARSLETAQRKLEGFRKMSESGLVLLEQQGIEPGHARRARMQSMFDVYVFLTGAFPQLVEEWKRRQDETGNQQDKTGAEQSREPGTKANR